MAQRGACFATDARPPHVTRLKALAICGALAAIIATSPAMAAPKEEHISGSDLLCLALNVYREARNQPIEGQLAVAHVTLNRYETSELPTICDVVFKSGNFAWTRDPKVVQEWPRDEAAWEMAQRVAHQALADPGADPVKGSTYFHTVSSEPDWAPGLVRVGRIGDHVFYRARNLALAPAPTN
ncbi:MAG TPA: cell wall hydrolase [Alphaproteobacteria bacterium]|nr:cell wall hydrolase [Alphaproteobacteria bacterium]